MNIDKLKAKILEFAKKNNLTVQEPWDKYFLLFFIVLEAHIVKARSQCAKPKYTKS